MLKPLVVSGLAAMATLTAVPAPAQAATCGTLPRAVQGDPVVRAGQAGAAYLFHDAHGWHLRVTHPGTSRMVVSGTITASRGISALHTYRLERGDVVRVVNGSTLAFRMTNVGRLDGVDFAAECSPAMRVDVAVNGTRATAGQVFLGAHRVHPASVPFTIRRS
jgi:hypothetical protein